MTRILTFWARAAFVAFLMSGMPRGYARRRRRLRSIARRRATIGGMPAKVVKRPPAAQGLVGIQMPAGTTDPAVDRFFGEQTAAIQRLEARLTRSLFRTDLAVGANRVIHRLGRPPIGCTVTPTVADATFAWAMTEADDRVAVIVVVGVAQPNAGIEFV